MSGHVGDDDSPTQEKRLTARALGADSREEFEKIRVEAPVRDDPQGPRTRIHHLDVSTLRPCRRHHGGQRIVEEPLNIALAADLAVSSRSAENACKRPPDRNTRCKSASDSRVEAASDFARSMRSRLSTILVIVLEIKA